MSGERVYGPTGACLDLDLMKGKDALAEQFEKATRIVGRKSAFKDQGQSSKSSPALALSSHYGLLSGARVSSYDEQRKIEIASTAHYLETCLKSLATRRLGLRLCYSMAGCGRAEAQAAQPTQNTPLNALEAPKLEVRIYHQLLSLHTSSPSLYRVFSFLLLRNNTELPLAISTSPSS